MATENAPIYVASRPCGCVVAADFEGERDARRPHLWRLVGLKVEKLPTLTRVGAFRCEEHR